MCTSSAPLWDSADAKPALLTRALASQPSKAAAKVRARAGSLSMASTTWHWSLRFCSAVLYTAAIRPQPITATRSFFMVSPTLSVGAPRGPWSQHVPHAVQVAQRAQITVLVKIAQLVLHHGPAVGAQGFVQAAHQAGVAHV